MKRKKMTSKKDVQEPQPVPAPEVQEETAVWTVFDTVKICLYSLLLFAAMTIQTGRMSLLLMALAFAAVVWDAVPIKAIKKKPFSHFRRCFGVPFLGLLAFALMNGLAAIYSPFGEYAVKEYYKFCASFSMAVILVALFEKKHVRGLLWGFAAVCAAIALLCVDSGVGGKLFYAFASATEKLGEDYSAVYADMMSSRVNGIYHDANITGAITGIALLIGLYLAHTEEKLWKRAAACLLAGMIGVGLLTSVSRGAILCFGLSALIYLAVERWDRIRLFFLMVCGAAAILSCGALAMLRMEQGSAVPALLCFASGGVLFLLDWLVGRRLAARLHGHGIAVLASCGAVCLLAVAAVAVVLTAMEPYTFSEGSRLYRGLALEPGEYTLEGDWTITDGSWVQIASQTPEQALLLTSTVLYQDALEGASFTLDEKAQVYFTIGCAAGDELRTVRLSNGAELPLKYRFLPESIAGRFQENLFTGNSYLLRVQFMKDAYQIFQTAPLIGRGLGSTEGLYTAVQPFFYQSLYVHNHILQVMSDMGLLGLAAFLALLLGTVWLLLRRLREDQDPLAVVLLACWVMINAHSAMEINFSVRCFQCAAFPLLLLPALLYGKPRLERQAVGAGAAVSMALCAYFAVFGVLLVCHREVERDASVFSASGAAEYMNGMREFAERDVFDHERYQLEFVGNAALLDSPLYNGTALEYVKELRSSGTYSACSGLSKYWYLPREEFPELFACSQEGIAQEASTSEAWNLQLDFYRGEVFSTAGMEHISEFLDGVHGLDVYLKEYSEGRMEEIALSAENQALLSTVDSVLDAGLDGEAAYTALSQLLSPENVSGEGA